MELRQLEYFVCVYQVGSVTRAARQLNIVQPALSMQIAKLEKEFGQTLFTRSTKVKSMTPTPAGDVAYRLLTPLLEQLIEARQTLIDYADAIS